ncbi:MAG TPA: hypothetical protein VN976_08110 [Verrucomicrobiae bacterium]|nr:hypothetical protein [Verrucomicrobiae bacterium]
MAVFISGSDENSGKHHRDTFFFGGWVGPEEDWSRFFAPAWQERVLAGPPKIPYLHMTDIRSKSWRGKWGLSRLDAEDRIDEAFILLDQMQTFYPIGLYLDAGFVRDQFKEMKVVSNATGAAKNFDPDYLCFLAYAYTVLNWVHLNNPEAEKVDFIVEINGHITKYIQEFHATLSEGLAVIGCPELAELLGQLIPGDKERVPLQAADLLLWYSARDKSTLDEREARRYFTIAHRKGARIPMSNEMLLKLKESFSDKKVPPSAWFKESV